MRDKRGSNRAHIRRRWAVVRPCNCIRALCTRRSPLVRSEHKVETGQTGRKSVHFGSHSEEDAVRGTFNPENEGENGPWGVVMGESVGVDTDCLDCLPPVVMRHAHSRDSDVRD